MPLHRREGTPALIYSCLAYFHDIIIGASLSEPHINGTAVHELYIYYGTSVTQIYGLHSSMDISAKYCTAHSRAWATGRMYAVLIYRIAYYFTLVLVV